MLLHFSKYQGTGNDFILIDNRLNSIQLNSKQIAFLCHRQFGIGADGLMLLELEVGLDFKMVYFNSDGHEAACVATAVAVLLLLQNTLELLLIKQNLLPLMV